MAGLQSFEPQCIQAARLARHSRFMLNADLIHVRLPIYVTNPTRLKAECRAAAAALSDASHADRVIQLTSFDSPHIYRLGVSRQRRAYPYGMRESFRCHGPLRCGVPCD